VYSTFRGKAELFLAVFDARVVERARRIAEVGAAAASPGEQGADLAREFAGTSANERDWSLLVIEFWVHAARDPELRREFAERHDALKAAVGRVFEEMLARTGKRLVLGTDTVALAAMALANGFTLERLANPDGGADERFPTIARLIMEGMTREVGEATEP
jgi:AcrR family transcriptional regulator